MASSPSQSHLLENGYDIVLHLMQTLLRIEETNQHALQTGCMQIPQLLGDGLITADKLRRHDAKRNPHVSLLPHTAPRLFPGGATREPRFARTAQRIDEVHHGIMIDLGLD